MFKNILTGCLSILFTLGLLEVALRFLEGAQYENDVYQQYKSVYSDERNEPYLFGHKSNVDVVLGSAPSSFRFITNSDGLREVNTYNKLPASAIFLGDSVIEGSSVDNEGTIDSIFEDRTGVVALNMGLGSSNSIQQLKFLESKYKDSYNAKLLVLGVCLNDIKQNYFLRYFDSEVGNWKKHSDYERLKSDAETKSSVENDYLIGQVKRLLMNFKVVEFVYYSLFPVRNGELYLAEEFTRQEILNTVELVKDIKQFTDQKKIQLIVTIFPTRSQTKKNLTEKGVQRELYSSLSESGIKTVSLDELLQNATDEYGENVVWHDNVHPKPFGYRLIAEYLAKNQMILKSLVEF